MVTEAKLTSYGEAAIMNALWGTSSMADIKAREYNRAIAEEFRKIGLLDRRQRKVEKMGGQCPFCGAAVKRTESYKTYDKRGDIKRLKDVLVFRCGTRKTAGNLQEEKPRVTLGKGCTGVA